MPEPVWAFPQGPEAHNWADEASVSNIGKRANFWVPRAAELSFSKRRLHVLRRFGFSALH